VNIVIWDLNEPAMQAVAKELRAKGAGVWTYRVDVSKRERVYEVAKQVGCACVPCLRGCALPNTMARFRRGG